MLMFFLLLGSLAAYSASPVLSDGSTIGGRIVGGRDGDIEEVPYMVSMEVDGSQNCGGSIISDFWIVSAAHCFHRDISRYTARVGSSLRSSGGTVHAVDFFINHPSYNTIAAHSHDITLVKVVVPFEFSAGVQPISLPVQSAILAAGSLTTISGWGFLKWTGGFPTNLQIAQVPIVSREECRARYGSSQISDDMLCAGFSEGGIDACTNDSGGPLVFNGVLFGVVSWGPLCAAPGSPGVYADVAYFRNWIAQNSGV